MKVDILQPLHNEEEEQGEEERISEDTVGFLKGVNRFALSSIYPPFLPVQVPPPCALMTSLSSRSACH